MANSCDNGVFASIEDITKDAIEFINSQDGTNDCDWYGTKRYFAAAVLESFFDSLGYKLGSAYFIPSFDRFPCSLSDVRADECNVSQIGKFVTLDITK